MKHRGCAWILSFVLMISLLSCAASQEKKQAHAKATRELGEAYMRQGSYTEALKEMLKAENINHNDHLIQNDLGLIYMSKFLTIWRKHFYKSPENKTRLCRG